MFNAVFGTQKKNADPIIPGMNSPDTFLAKRDKNAAEAASSSATSFGVNLGINGKPLRAQLGEIGRRVVTTNQKYRTEIDKHKKILAINKQLSQAYVQSLYAIVDVSRLLNDFASFFSLLTTELDQTDAQLGALQKSDVRHLELLTRAQMTEFQKKFGEGSDAIKNLYLKQGMKGQAEIIDTVRRDLDAAINATDVIYRDISVPKATGGGLKKRIVKKKTKC